MTYFRGLWRLSTSYFLITIRSRMALFWNLVFPIFFLLVFGFILGGNDPDRVTFILPGLLTITVISGTFFGVSLLMVTLRENGIYRRFRVTPVSGLVVVLAHAFIAFFTLSLSVTVQVIFALFIFKINFSASVLLPFITICAAGFFGFIPLGLLIGSVAKDMKSAPAISNLIFFPMMFLSGAAFPFFMLPGWIQDLAKFLPATYLVDSLQGVLVRLETPGDLLQPITILVVTGIVAFGLNGYLFRWESTQPLRPKKVALSLGALAIIYLTAAFTIPAFKMATLSGNSKKEAEQMTVRVLKGMTILDGLGGRIENGRIVLNGDKIMSVGTISDAMQDPDSALVEDLSGTYLIPGLIESHMHLGGSPGSSTTAEEFQASRQIHALQAYLGLGITSILSLTDNHHDLKALRAAISKGKMRAPGIFYSGPSITAPGGHPASLFQKVPMLAETLTRQISTAAEAESAIGELADLGVDIVKLVLEDGTSFMPVPRLTEPAFRAAVKAAHKAGLITTAHVNSDKNARLAIDAGIDGLDHIPTDLSAETCKLLKAAGISITPTLAITYGQSRFAAGDSTIAAYARPWIEPYILESLTGPESWITQNRQNPFFVQAMKRRFQQSIEATRLAISHGVQIIAGSDAGNAATFHGPGLITELELLIEEAGLSHSDALMAATSRAADRLNQKTIGRVAEGCQANFVILGDDPLKNSKAYRNIKGVYLSGNPVAREKLLTTSPGIWQPAQ